MLAALSHRFAAAVRWCTRKWKACVQCKQSRSAERQPILVAGIQNFRPKLNLLLIRKYPHDENPYDGIPNASFADLLD